MTPHLHIGGLDFAVFLLYYVLASAALKLAAMYLRGPLGDALGAIVA